MFGRRRSGSLVVLSSSLLAVLALACGEGGGSSPDAAPIDAVRVDAPPDPTIIETRSLTIGPVTVPPGGEDTICVVLDLGNTAPRLIRGVRTELTDGTHHVIVTRSADAPSPVSPCGPFAGGGVDAGVLFIAQQRAASMQYPTGAGLPIAAHQSIHLEMHYFNATTEPLAIAGTAYLDLAEDTGALRPVRLLFTGSTALSIPAHGSATVTSSHGLPAGVDLFAVTAHTHRLGTRATVGLGGQLLHDSTDWDEREVSTFDPITVTAGQELALRCDYVNPTDQTVGFGLSATQEMCFLWAHYVE